MSDLSWLNPTPHAIAVYASRPLSPVAAQHSLPSGRYSSLGPDFHRLDRTSLRLAHSFNHLVGAHETGVCQQAGCHAPHRPSARAEPAGHWYRPAHESCWSIHLATAPSTAAGFV